MFQILVERHPKIADDFLNIRLESNHDSIGGLLADEDDIVLSIDLSPFHKPTSTSTSNCHDNLSLVGETASVRAMFREGHRDLIKHPVTEAFVHLKWQQLKGYFYCGFIYTLVLALVASISVKLDIDGRHSLLTTIFRWAVLGLQIPFMIKMFLDAARLRSELFVYDWEEVSLCRRRNWIPIPSISFAIKILFVTTAFLHALLASGSLLQRHASFWMLLLSWLNLLAATYKCPSQGVYVHILMVVLKDVSRFIFATLAILVGFLLTFHTLLSKGQFHTVLASFFNILSMSFGNFDYKFDPGSSPYPGTTEAVFVLFILIVSLAFFNILLGISIANVKDILFPP